ncbi:E3 ubiquitin-protein ligase TRIM39-like [Scomber japonicus]|uniref:E3 ubiquitin-protein ligase TRIM39-like n=1 Tax=Scomber japonicus TaxID=13676 RepID=UPI0023061267|nr:E3 ubiquitin-protein ligase TRIM39-like [Scomber japonicus]
MSAASCLRSEDQFLCSICLDVFTDPVTTPCGHNFCKNCINEHWNSNVLYLCPLCKKTFYTKPELHINTLLSEMVSQFKQEAQQKASSSSSEQQAAKPGEVPCEVCTGTKLKALKSCMVCLTSFCETHLEPHLTATRLKRHQLIDPVENLEDRMCMKHDKPLELFCKTDQTCVCMLCSVLDHKTHEFVPLKEEYEGKKAELGKTEAEIQEMIQKRRLKIQEIKHSVDLSKEAADREKAEGVQVFTALKESVERSLNELIETIEEKQRTTEKQAEDFIKELEQEISELKKRRSEVEKLSHSEDHLHLLQNFLSLNAAPPTKDWTEVSVRPSYEGTVVKAVAQLEETLSEQMKKHFELRRVQQYAVDVTLDPDTAHSSLILSDDGKQVYCGDVTKNLPDNPERFTRYVSVLGKQSLSSGRFYFEVQVKEKTEWDLGVARESINRKKYTPLIPQYGFWTIILRNRNEYKADYNPPVYLSLKSRPQKVGVFVDYEEGLVSFYDVDAAALIYSFTGCSFTEKLYPYFCPCFIAGGKNSAPLIICPVRGSHAVCSTQPIVIEEGEDAVLQCWLDSPIDVSTYTCDWKRLDLTGFICVYRNKQDLHDEQMKRYRGRTTFIHEDLIKGNLTLKISSVQLNDSGQYECYIPKLETRCVMNVSVVPKEQLDSMKRGEDNITTRPPVYDETKPEDHDAADTRNHYWIALSFGVFISVVFIGVLVKSGTICGRRRRPMNEAAEEGKDLDTVKKDLEDVWR